MTYTKQARWTAAAALLALATAASGAARAEETTDPCAGADPALLCTPFYACVEAFVGDEALLFVGRALGEAPGGPLSGAFLSGLACGGEWRILPDGRGAASGACEDGRSFDVAYDYLHRPTGTAVGEGVTSFGERIQAWSGPQVGRYLREAAGRLDGRLACGPVSIPVS